MTNQEKIEILDNMLKKYGLSLNDVRVSDFFYGDRELAPLSDDQMDDLTYSHLVKPTVLSVLPSDIENASYGNMFELSTLMDWYLYKNSGDNPLVFENLESDPRGIKESFEARKQKEGFMQVSPKGKIFNGNDGNHRLLTLIIKHFVERTASKSEDEKKAIDDKYRMNLNASYPISRKLSNLLANEQDKIRSYYSRDRSYYQACLYREKVFAKAHQGDYIAEYDPKTKIYKYSFNGRVFEGSEQELIEYLQTKQASIQPIMTYKCGDVYYVSCHNRVWKTKDKERAVKLANKINEEYKAGNIEEDVFLAVKDCDSENGKAYSLLFPGLYIDQQEQDKARDYAKNLLQIINEKEAEVLGKDTLEVLIQQCEKSEYWGDLNIGDMKFENLSREEYLNISSILTEMANILYPKNQDLTL